MVEMNISNLVSRHEAVQSALAEVDISPWQVILLPLSIRSDFLTVPIQTLAVVGRRDANSEATPHCDLTPYGGRGHGVSRQHAIIFPQQGDLYILDLDSSNGTYLNGEQLEPWKPYVLRTGDYIEFGTLDVVIHAIGPLTDGSPEDATLPGKRNSGQ